MSSGWPDSMVKSRALTGRPSETSRQAVTPFRSERSPGRDRSHGRYHTLTTELSTPANVHKRHVTKPDVSCQLISCRSLTISTTRSSAVLAPDHPRSLRDLDRSYLIGWGNREVLVVSLTSGCCAALLLAWGSATTGWWWLGLVPVVALGALGVLFFRNPTRRVPTEPRLCVAPADGQIRDITELERTDFLDEPCVCIGIFLSVLNVHVNRAPAAGHVVELRYRPGAFHDARSAAAARENEANWIVLRCDEEDSPEDTTLVVKQISGAIARRIICPLSPGMRVARGGLLGMIKYGSRTELYVPKRLRAAVKVRVNETVRGGETVLATWNPHT